MNFTALKADLIVPDALSGNYPAKITHVGQVGL